MYFESVLSYLATFINDISLMNFSNRLTGLLSYISSYPILCFSLVLFVQISVSNNQRFNLFYSVIKLRLITPRIWDCKGRNLFGICKIYFLNLLFFF